MSVLKACDIVLASLLSSFLWNLSEQKAIPSYLAVADSL